MYQDAAPDRSHRGRFTDGVNWHDEPVVLYRHPLPPQDGVERPLSPYEKKEITVKLTDGVIPLVLRQRYSRTLRALDGHYSSDGKPVLEVPEPDKIFTGIWPNDAKARLLISLMKVTGLMMADGVAPRLGYYPGVKKWQAVDKTDRPIDLPPFGICTRYFVTNLETGSPFPMSHLESPNLRVENLPNRDGIKLKFS